MDLYREKCTHSNIKGSYLIPNTYKYETEGKTEMSSRILLYKTYVKMSSITPSYVDYVSSLYFRFHFVL